MPVDHCRINRGETHPGGRLGTNCTPSHFHVGAYTRTDILKMLSA